MMRPPPLMDMGFRQKTLDLVLLLQCSCRVMDPMAIDSVTVSLKRFSNKGRDRLKSVFIRNEKWFHF